MAKSCIYKFYFASPTFYLDGTKIDCDAIFLMEAISKIKKILFMLLLLLFTVIIYLLIAVFIFLD